MTLKELKIGQSALIKAVGGTGALRQTTLSRYGSHTWS